jgi:hypothetical protein
MQRIAGAAVRISVTGDTKTRKFRRTGNLPALWVEVLRAHRVAHRVAATALGLAEQERDILSDRRGGHQATRSITMSRMHQRRDRLRYCFPMRPVATEADETPDERLSDQRCTPTPQRETMGGQEATDIRNDLQHAGDL